MIHAAYRCLSDDEGTATFSYAAAATVRATLDSFITEHREQIRLSLGYTDVMIDTELRALRHPVHSHKDAYLGDFHIRCLAAVLGRNIVVLNWYDAGCGTPVTNRPAGVFPADITWKGANAFHTFDTIDALTSWQSFGVLPKSG